VAGVERVEFGGVVGELMVIPTRVRAVLWSAGAGGVDLVGFAGPPGGCRRFSGVVLTR